jgi:hypothetical protein
MLLLAAGNPGVRKNLEVFSQPLQWEEQALAVRVSPKFRWRERRQSHLVWPYFKADELTGDAIQAAIRIMELTFPSSLGRPAVLDVRRGQLHHGRRRSNNFDAWLTGSFRTTHRQLKLDERHIIEDAIHLDSKSSQLVQMADLVAWSAYAAVDRHPRNEFAWGRYETYLAERDPGRQPKELTPKNS